MMRAFDVSRPEHRQYFGHLYIPIAILLCHLSQILSSGHVRKGLRPAMIIRLNIDHTITRVPFDIHRAAGIATYSCYHASEAYEISSHHLLSSTIL